MLYRDGDKHRDGNPHDAEAPWRDAFSRDYSRVIHSASFRRLQGKTQVFPGHESDFFRNRLTHSLEVAQIAEGIAERLNYEASDLQRFASSERINTRLCVTVSLIHDLGHPPFGHNGERALDDCMRKHGGFEGNAQSLRIVSRLEKKVLSANGERCGLDLCYRTLASTLKYDRCIPRSRRSGAKLVKGYYGSESGLIQRLKASVVGASTLDGKKKFRTLECSIMDIADDVAYSTYDFEDCLKAGFLTPAGILTSGSDLSTRVADEVSKQLNRLFTAGQVVEVFAKMFEPDHTSTSVDGIFDFSQRFRAYEAVASDGYYRTKLSSELVSKAISSCVFELDEEHPALSRVALSQEAKERVEVLKQYTFIATIYSSRVKVPEYRGYEVVRGIFEALAGERGDLLMPDDVRHQYDAAKGDYDGQMRVVCDFVAGMTDRYAMESYGRLHSDTAQSMFKPL